MLFIFYEGAVMLTTLALYAALAVRRRLRGAGVIAAASAINLTAAGVQASTASLRFVVPFDHNGGFPLVQMLGLAALAAGLRMGSDAGNLENSGAFHS